MKQTGTWNPTLDEPEMDVEKFILFFFVPKFFWEISTIYLPNVVRTIPTGCLLKLDDKIVLLLLVKIHVHSGKV